MGSMMQRPLLQDLVKSAMEATVAKADIALEAHRQLGLPAQTKTAAAAPPAPQHIPSEVCEKYASALEYLAKQADIQLPSGTSGIGPGEGPNALEVTQAPGGENPFDAGQTGSATSGNQVPVSPPMASFPDSKAPANAMATNLDMEHGEQPVDPMNNETASNAAQKTSAAKLAQRNLALLKKMAETPGIPVEAAPEEEAVAEEAAPANPHLLRRALLGNPLSAAIEAQKGQKMRAFGEAYGEHLRNAVPGMALGGAGGAGLGALAGLVSGGRIPVGTGAMMGGVLGADLGAAAGTARGNLGQRATEIHGKYAALHAKNLAALGLRKQAEDAINPAQISAGPASAEGAEAPEGVSPSEEGPVPSVPSDMGRQESFIGSNEAAIAYTKRQAKADPKRDLGQLLAEPALSASTDKALELAFAHTNEAGAKVAAKKPAPARPAAKQASAKPAAPAAKPAAKTAAARTETPAQRLTKTAAAHALLLKLAEEACADKAKKVKTSNLSTPEAQMGGMSSAGMAPQGAKPRPTV